MLVLGNFILDEVIVYFDIVIGFMDFYFIDDVSFYWVVLLVLVDMILLVG